MYKADDDSEGELPPRFVQSPRIVTPQIWPIVTLGAMSHQIVAPSSMVDGPLDPSDSARFVEHRHRIVAPSRIVTRGSSYNPQGS